MLAIYLTAGYPDWDKSLAALRLLDKHKIDLIELGIPFSDPLADGPVIQNASFKALEAGMTIDRAFDLVNEARNYDGYDPNSGTGLSNLIFFSYYNPLYVYGFEKLAANCAKNGIKGVLIPDLPMDEASELIDIFKNYDLTLTLLAAVTSTEERLEQITQLSSPFVYLVSRVGVTGSKQDIESMKSSGADSEEEALELVRKQIRIMKAVDSSKNIGLGFGIDSKAKVEEAFELGADMAIIGTKALKVLEESDDKLSQLEKFLVDISLVKAVK